MTTITLIAATDAMLNLNAERRLHHHTRARMVRDIRGQVAALASGADRHAGPVRIVIQWRWATGHRRDSTVGNWTPVEKAAIDAIVSVGVIPDDSDAHVWGFERRRARTGDITPGYAALTITIEDVS